MVEDNLITVDALRALLTGHGYRVVGAHDGLDALEILRRELRPDVIVLDLTLPKMDGHSFHAALRADPQLTRIPVVIYAGGPDSVPLPGIVGHVVKGRDNPDVLLGFIEAACARGGGGPASS